MPSTATKLGGGTVKLDAKAFEAEFNMALVHETVRAEQAARRRGTASTKTRGKVSRRRREALEAEGHRPRPCRLVAQPDLDRRRHRLRSAAARLHLQDQPQGPPGGAA